MPASFCPVCQTQHGSKRRCPGELLATGPERHGWRVRVRTSSRDEVYGVLVAEAGEFWRARILTYPGMLWSVPGGRGTIKFAGDTAAEAESQAIEFIREHCRVRGYAVDEGAPEVESVPVASERRRSGRPRATGDPRHLRSLVVRFGVSKPDRVGMTADLSAGGLFVITDRPPDEGQPVKLLLELEGFTVPLAGKVAWMRRRAVQGRPAGMGIQLKNPPNLYGRYVRTLDEEVPDDETGGGA